MASHLELELLEAAAHRLAEIRAYRQDLAEQERLMRRAAGALLQKYHRTAYQHDGITLTLVAGAGAVTVEVES